MKLGINNNEKRLCKRLNEVFGKDTFTEDELTKQFYVELCTQCSEYFTTEDGTFDLDLFWSDETKSFLLKKKQII